MFFFLNTDTILWDHVIPIFWANWRYLHRLWGLCLFGCSASCFLAQNTVFGTRIHYWETPCKNFGTIMTGHEKQIQDEDERVSFPHLPIWPRAPSTSFSIGFTVKLPLKFNIAMFHWCWTSQLTQTYKLNQISTLLSINYSVSKLFGIEKGIGFGFVQITHCSSTLLFHVFLLFGVKIAKSNKPPKPWQQV